LATLPLTLPSSDFERQHDSTCGIMATSNLTLEQIYDYFKENGNVVKNRELVHHFKEYLTDPATKGNETCPRLCTATLF
jgi:hypothetical protein